MNNNPPTLALVRFPNLANVQVIMVFTINSILSYLGEPIRGTSGKELLKFVGTISKEDLEIMKQAIEEGCEQINESEW